MKDISGFCDECYLWFLYDKGYDERIHHSICPECGLTLKRSDGSLDRIAKELSLKPKDLSNKTPMLRRHGER